VGHPHDDVVVPELFIGLGRVVANDVFVNELVFDCSDLRCEGGAAG
jgi:hypothetical protein